MWHITTSATPPYWQCRQLLFIHFYLFCLTVLWDINQASQVYVFSIIKALYWWPWWHVTRDFWIQTCFFKFVVIFVSQWIYFYKPKMFIYDNMVEEKPSLQCDCYHSGRTTLTCVCPGRSAICDTSLKMVSTKYFKVIRELDPGIAREARNIITKPPDKDKYEKL